MGNGRRPSSASPAINVGTFALLEPMISTYMPCKALDSMCAQEGVVECHLEYQFRLGSVAGLHATIPVLAFQSLVELACCMLSANEVTK